MKCPLVSSSGSPPTKRRHCNPLDGTVLPWPVTINDFEDLGRLRLIRSDLSCFAKVVDAKIDSLESLLAEAEEEEEEDEDPKEKEYWDQVFPDLDDEHIIRHN
jgi:hypothetical protein